MSLEIKSRSKCVRSPNVSEVFLRRASLTYGIHKNMSVNENSSIVAALTVLVVAVLVSLVVCYHTEKWIKQRYHWHKQLSANKTEILPRIWKTDVEPEKWPTVDTRDQIVRTNNINCKRRYTNYCSAATSRWRCNYNSCAVSLLNVNPKYTA